MSASKQCSSKLKETVKGLLPGYIVAFVFCFMLFVFEPLLMYSVNQIDFWFDLPMMIGPVLTVFGIFFGGCVVILSAVYFINKAIVKDKEPLVYRIVTVLLFVVFFVTYIQGNFLAGALPALDGSEIDWNGFGAMDFATLGVLTVTVCVIIILNIKKGINRTFFYSAIASVVVFIMLTISLISEMISYDAFKMKYGVITTNNDFDTVSSDKNFVVFLADAVGSSEFGNVINDNPEYKKTFEDFTYYPDTLGSFPCTRDTIPVVLGGAVNKNEMPFEQFSSQALNNSPFFKKLNENNYDISVYDSELIWYGEKNFNLKNSADYKNYLLPVKTFFIEELKYVLFKYLPYAYKGYSKIDSMNFNGLVDKYIWDNRTVYSMIQSEPVLEKSSKNKFKFIHVEGAHIPFRYDKDLNILTDRAGSYEEKIESVITLVNAYIERLKVNGTYDNTVIIIMSDHGNTNLNSAEDMLVRANPMLMIKGIDEKHDFVVSDKPLSYEDLMGIYSKLLDGDTAEQATADIPDDRERYFMWYRNFRLENHIEEYVVTDKAWEWRKFKKTGKEYDL